MDELFPTNIPKYTNLGQLNRV